MNTKTVVLDGSNRPREIELVPIEIDEDTRKTVARAQFRAIFGTGADVDEAFDAMYRKEVAPAIAKALERPHYEDQVAMRAVRDAARMVAARSMQQVNAELRLKRELSQAETRFKLAGGLDAEWAQMRDDVRREILKKAALAGPAPLDEILRHSRAIGL